MKIINMFCLLSVLLLTAQKNFGFLDCIIYIHNNGNAPANFSVVYDKNDGETSMIVPNLGVGQTWWNGVGECRIEYSLKTCGDGWKKWNLSWGTWWNIGSIKANRPMMCEIKKVLEPFWLDIEYHYYFTDYFTDYFAEEEN